ncbi:hypothetical protein AB0P15_18260 [Streptomyces sp. NPDC087917]|uniref:hypothetical protein n=1 Tax=Streptomyces sp. NPDC087917 TaxID=3155060 RepID=UPI00341C3627
MQADQSIPEPRSGAENAPESDTPEFPATPPETPDATGSEAVPARPRRRGRTTLLIAAALVLGAIAGTATGYAIQYHREPTPLAPLAQQRLVTPKALAPDDATTNKTINANRWHKTDDDLAKLLIEAPGGAKVAGTGYESLDFFAASFFEEPERALPNLATTGVRRVASTAWAEDDQVFVEVRLLQFRDRSGADDYQLEQSDYMPEVKYAGNRGVAIPGLSGELGHVWVYSKAEEKAGYLPLRSARAIARRGDIVLDINYIDNRGKIDQNDVVELAKRQLERL